MVPANKFDDTIDQLATMGKVQTEHISGNDVSAQYVDLQARLANQQAQRNAMLALLKRAQSISDIIAVQTQIGQITGQIEQLKGQIQYIEHNTAYSTVTVNLLEAGAPVQTASRDNWGFATALRGLGQINHLQSERFSGADDLDSLAFGRNECRPQSLVTPDNFAERAFARGDRIEHNEIHQWSSQEPVGSHFKLVLIRRVQARLYRHIDRNHFGGGADGSSNSR